jgi:hypothetical protein
MPWTESVRTFPLHPMREQSAGNAAPRQAEREKPADICAGPRRTIFANAPICVKRLQISSATVEPMTHLSRRWGIV